MREDGSWQPIRADGKFLFHVKALGKMFRAKYVAGLRAEYSGQRGPLNPVQKGPVITVERGPLYMVDFAC